MFASPSSLYCPEESQSQNSNTPLLCWDIANPAITKRLKIAEDIQQIEHLQSTNEWTIDLNFRKLLSNNYILVVTNVAKEIVWASQDFQTMTGYSLSEAVGRKPVFLQGEKTSTKSKQYVSEKLSNFEVAETKLLNYRKDATPYWCQVKIYPIQNTEGVFTHFVAVEKELD